MYDLEIIDSFDGFYEALRFICKDFLRSEYCKKKHLCLVAVFYLTFGFEDHEKPNVMC